MKTAKVTHQKRAFQLLRGLWVEWKDADLLGGKPPEAGTIGHNNPVCRLMAKDIWTKYKLWLLDKQRMCWRMSVRVIFRHGDQEEHVDLAAEEMGTVSEINEFFYRELVEVMREAKEKGYADQFVHAEYRIECLGHFKQSP